MAAQQLEHFRFPCTLCEAHFGTPSESGAHRMSAHGKPEDQAYLCHACCGRPFASQEAVELHANFAHLRSAREDKKFSCRRCKGVFRTQKAFLLHVKYDHDECTIDEEGRRWCAKQGCKFTNPADYGMTLHAIHEHEAVINESVKRDREAAGFAQESGASPAKRARSTPAVSQPQGAAVPPAPAGISMAVPSTTLAGESTTCTVWGAFHRTEAEWMQAQADYCVREGIPLTQTPVVLPAPQAEVVDLTADDIEVVDLTTGEQSPPLAAPTVPSAPRPARLSSWEQRRAEQEARVRADAFLAEQEAALKQQQRENNISGGAEVMAVTLKRRKHRQHMEKWRDGERARRGPTMSAETEQRLEAEKAVEVERNQAKVAEKEATRKEASKKRNKRYHDKKKATSAPAVAEEEEASPEQQVEASPAVEARPGTASIEQDTGASGESGETSTLEEDARVTLVWDEELEEQIARAFEEDAEKNWELTVEEDVKKPEDPEQAVDDDDLDGLFAGEFEVDDAPARPVTPAASAPPRAGTILCLPKMRKD